MRFLRVALPLIGAGVAAVALAAAQPDTILAGDAEAYRARMAELFAGKIPYVEFPFEHLPGMLVPLSVAWLIGGWSGLSGYSYALAGVSLICLVATSFLLVRIEDRIKSNGLAVRWLLLTVPLLPFLLFRNDSWSVLLMVGGLWLAITGHGLSSTVVLGLGVVSKLWPAVWAVPAWWQRKRATGVFLGLLAIVGLAITFSPAVQSIQDPQGLHSETLTGSLFGLARSVTGADLGLSNTAAVYIEAPSWAMLGNLVVGAGLGMWSLHRLRQGFSWEGAFLLTGALVGAGLVASPFFSTQYVAWLGPFVAVNRRLTGPGLLISVASLILITTWFRLFDGEVWWWGLLLARNLLLVGLVVGLILVKSSSQAALSRSSPNDLSATGGL